MDYSTPGLPGLDKIVYSSIKLISTLQTRCPSRLPSWYSLAPFHSHGKFSHLTCYHWEWNKTHNCKLFKFKSGEAGRDIESHLPLATISIIHNYSLKLLLVVVAQSLSLCDPMDCSMPGSSVLHCLLESTQIHVQRVSDAI